MATPATAPVTSASVNREGEFERRRREVDASPLLYVAQVQRNNNFPETIKDPEQLYLYGRALMLSGRPNDAMPIFRRALEEINANSRPPRDSMRIETLLMMSAMATNATDRDAARQQLDRAIERADNSTTGNVNSPGNPNSLTPQATQTPQGALPQLSPVP